MFNVRGFRLVQKSRMEARSCSAEFLPLRGKGPSGDYLQIIQSVKFHCHRFICTKKRFFKIYFTLQKLFYFILEKILIYHRLASTPPYYLELFFLLVQVFRTTVFSLLNYYLYFFDKNYLLFSFGDANLAWILCSDSFPKVHHLKCGDFLVWTLGP